MARARVDRLTSAAWLSLDQRDNDPVLFWTYLITALKTAAPGLLGLAYWASGDLEAGHSAYAECMAGLYLAGHVTDTFGCADMYVGMGELSLERDDIPAAAAQFLHSQRPGEHLGLPQNPYRWRVGMARLRQAQGELSGALDFLDDAERRYVSDFFPNVRPIPALRARVWVVQGSVEKALGWAREQGLTTDDDLSYPHEFEHITLARVLMARPAAEHPAADLAGLLERLRQSAEVGGRTGSVIELLVLQALCHGEGGDAAAALASLQRALTLAEPEGYVRVFVDEGAAMGLLLRAAAKQGPMPVIATDS